MFARVAPVAVLASAAVSLYGCGGGGTTTTTKSPSPGPSLINGTCGDNFPGVEDCDRVDFGSCGNACCEITTTVLLSPEAVANALNASLANGGPDGHYELQQLFEGVTGFTSLGETGGFLGQVHHTTAGPGHYTDNVNILIEPDAENTAKVTAFSLSLIGGALGDSGQGYKNIIMALKGANLAGWTDAMVANVGGSCPSPAGTAAPAQASTQSEVVEITQRRRLADDLIDGTCGLNSSVQVLDCQNKDSGSCGNACCSLTVTLSVSAAQAAMLLNSSFDTGGPDGQFTKMPMAEKTVGVANLTGIAPDSFCGGSCFMGQFHHMTTGGQYHFNDTVNFNIVPDSAGGATMNAFSTSLIGGAYGDAGQNYKNLMMLLSVFGSNASVEPGKFSESCPGPSATWLV